MWVALMLLIPLLAAGPIVSPATTKTLTADPAPPDLFAGHWEGKIKLPPAGLVVRIDLASKAGAWSGTIDIPQQNAAGMVLDPIAITGTRIRFSIRNVPGNPSFDGSLADGKISGQFRQGALSLPFDLGREKVDVHPPRRPQEPTTRPYREEDVAYAGGAIHFAATLTLPQGKGPFPAAVLITGSGPQNRDEEVFGHKPFLVIADRLTRAGIAVLRADDRGVGGSSGGSVNDATTEELAGDTQAAVAYLKTRPEIEAGRIGLIGHSEGGIIAPLVASRSKDIAFVIMLAGTGLPGDQVLLKQSEAIARADGTDAVAVKQQISDLGDLIHAVEGSPDPAVVRAQVRNLAHRQLDALPADKRKPLKDVEAQADAQVAAMMSRWFRFFLTYDPRVALRTVTVPVLALDGELDTQVSAEQNLPEIEKALREAGNTDITVRRLPGLNHLFQTARTGSPAEYGAIEETFNEEALELIKSWILKRVARPATAP